MLNMITKIEIEMRIIDLIRGIFLFVKYID